LNNWIASATLGFNWSISRDENTECLAKKVYKSDFKHDFRLDHEMKILWSTSKPEVFPRVLSLLQMTSVPLNLCRSLQASFVSAQEFSYLTDSVSAINIALMCRCSHYPEDNYTLLQIPERPRKRHDLPLLPQNPTKVRVKRIRLSPQIWAYKELDILWYATSSRGYYVRLAWEAMPVRRDGNAGKVEVRKGKAEVRQCRGRGEDGKGEGQE